MAPATELEYHLIEFSKMLHQLLTYSKRGAKAGVCKIYCPTLQMCAVYDSTHGFIQGDATIGAINQYRFVAKYTSHDFEVDCNLLKVRYDGSRWSVIYPQSESGSGEI